MKELGVEKFFIEKISGKNAERPELKRMLDYVREGDTLVVESISRLSRSIRDLLWIIDKLERSGVTFVSQKEAIDTSSPQGRFVLAIFGALSELEREQTLQRHAKVLNWPSWPVNTKEGRKFRLMKNGSRSFIRNGWPKK